jgi:hypothetical protein
MRIIDWLRISNFSIKKTIGIALFLAIIIICIIFSLPLKTISYDVVEPYTVTEMKSEPYTVNEPYTEEELVEKTEVVFDEKRLSVPLGINIPFEVDKPDTTLTVHFSSPVQGAFYIFSSASHLLYEQYGERGDFEMQLPVGTYTGRFSENTSWSEEIYIRMTLKWTETEEKTLYREVTKYREVPVQVEKQRTTTEYKKVSLWVALFK